MKQVFSIKRLCLACFILSMSTILLSFSGISYAYGDEIEEEEEEFNLDDATVWVSSYYSNYTGLPCKIALTVFHGQDVLEEGKDYLVLYDGKISIPVEVGEYQVSIWGFGSYQGEAALGIFRIVPAVSEGVETSVNLSLGTETLQASLTKTERGTYTIAFPESFAQEIKEGKISEESEMAMLYQYLTGETLNKDKRLLCVGDSYLSGWSPEKNVVSWGTFLGEILGCETVLEHDGGSGYYNVGGYRECRNIDLLSHATTVGNGQYDIICIGSGINDSTSSYSYETEYDWVVQTLTYARNTWPNAEIWVFPNLWAGGGKLPILTTQKLCCRPYWQVLTR